MPKAPTPKSSQFAVTAGLISYKIEGYCYGLAPASSCISMIGAYAQYKKWNSEVFI